MRFTKEQLIKEFGEEAYLKALQTCNIFQRCHPTRRIDNFNYVPVTWLIVPSRNREMLSLITDYEFDLQQNGVGNIIHDKLILK